MMSSPRVVWSTGESTAARESLDDRCLSPLPGVDGLLSQVSHVMCLVSLLASPKPALSARFLYSFSV